jgi:hypothetical protein
MGLSQSDPVPIASTIKQNPSIQICAALFALKGDTRPEAQRAQEMLNEIVSSPTQYKTVWDAETLRKFFEASVSSGKNIRIG